MVTEEMRGLVQQPETQCLHVDLGDHCSIDIDVPLLVDGKGAQVESEWRRPLGLVDNHWRQRKECRRQIWRLPRRPDARRRPGLAGTGREVVQAEEPRRHVASRRNIPAAFRIGTSDSTSAGRSAPSGRLRANVRATNVATSGADSAALATSRHADAQAPPPRGRPAAKGGPPTAPAPGAVPAALATTRPADAQASPSPFDTATAATAVSTANALSLRSGNSNDSGSASTASGSGRSAFASH